MVVAVIAVLVMEPTVDDIVDVVAMRNRLVSAAGSMDVAGLMTLVAIVRRALDRISRRHFNNVLIDLVPHLMVQMSVMQVIDVIAVSHREMTTLRSVMMGMLGMREVVRGRHEPVSFRASEA